MSIPSALVIGAGFSGSLLAVHLLKQPRPLRVALAEREDAFGPGLAYGRASNDHLLNVRAANMSAFPDAPSHFVDWLRGNGAACADGSSFARRSQFGAYVQDQLRAAAGAGGGRLDLVGDAVTSVAEAGDGRLEAQFSIGRRERFDAVVLAIGAAPPPCPPVLAALDGAHPRYVADPWARGALARVGPDDRVMVLGAGLTMVDVLEDLGAAGRRGRILALSRRGLVPHRHAATVTVPPPSTVFAGPLSRRLRRFRKAAAADWRSTFDSLRPHVERLWRELPQRERRRFLRHLRPYWDAHRHRQAPAVADRTDSLIAAGRLCVRAGRLVEAADDGDRLRVTWRPRGEPWAQTATADWLINCTGWEGDLARSRDPLVGSLLATGLARPDPLELGLAVTSEGLVIAADGTASPRLSAIGSLTRGAFWECTAVPDIRGKAAELAALLGDRIPYA